MRGSLSITAIAGVTCVSNAFAQSNINLDHKYGWGENIGWMNWRDAGGSQLGVRVHASTLLSGWIWCENAGWITLGDGSPGGSPTNPSHYANAAGTDVGVNIDPLTGNLFGYGWGENVGWINFDTASPSRPDEQARYDAVLERFFGYAWGENVGWINLDDAIHYVAVCYADCDGNASLDIFDFLCFQSSFVTGEPYACDCDVSTGPGVCDIFDFLCFQNAFVAGCP